MSKINIPLNTHHTMTRQKAEAELAYTLEASRLKQAIRREEVEVEVVERRRQVCCVYVCVCV